VLRNGRRRLLRKLQRKGNRTVIHELRGRAANRKLPGETEQLAITVLSDPVHRGFGPTLAAEYLRKRHQITVSKETVRQWMAKAGLWKANRRRVVEVHEWRAWRQLNIVWIPAHSPQAKGRIGRQFSTAQDRIVKGNGVRTIEEANAYLDKKYLPWWNQTLTVKPSDAADAHRPLDKEYDLAAILSHAELRQMTNDFTVRYNGKVYQIDRRDVRVGMRKAMARVEPSDSRTGMCTCAAAHRPCTN
jgi:hypothetical protein